MHCASSGPGLSDAERKAGVDEQNKQMLEVARKRSLDDHEASSQLKLRATRPVTQVVQYGYHDRSGNRKAALTGIRIGLQYMRAQRQCDEYVNVNALIEFLKTSRCYAIPDDITRRIIVENIPSTFDAVPEGSYKGPALAICDRNPEQLSAVSEGAIFTSFVSADGHGGPSGAPLSSTSGAAQQS